MLWLIVGWQAHAGQIILAAVQVMKPMVRLPMGHWNGQVLNAIGTQHVVCAVHAVTPDDLVGLAANPGNHPPGPLWIRVIHLKDLAGVIASLAHWSSRVIGANGPESFVAGFGPECPTGVLDSPRAEGTVADLKGPSDMPHPARASAAHKHNCPECHYHRRCL